MQPETNVTTATLRTLHRIHQQLSDLKARQSRGPNLIRVNDANVERAEEALARARDEITAVRVASDNKQLQLRTGEEKTEKLQQQLNSAGSNREYQALKDQIAGTKMTNSVLADEILEGLEKLDELGEKAAQAESALAAARDRAATIRAEVQEQEPVIQGEIERLEGELRGHESSLPGDIREAYQRVLRARGEDAMAAVEGEYCGGCNQHVPLNMVSGLMLAKPIFCKACGRLLYLPEDRSPT